jgi:predicted peptidase
MRILSIIVFLSLLGSGRAQEKPQDHLFIPREFHKSLKASYDYLLFLPRDYDAHSTGRWPTILFLHGAGERGTNVWRTDIHGPSRYIAAHPDFPFIMVTPLCASNEVWSSDALCALLDETIRKFKVDTNRIYLTGLSMGGFGTWDMALAWPERFAAAVPIAGGGSDLPILLARTGYATPAKVAAMKSLPIWAFHGARDTIVPPEESQRLVDALKKLGATNVNLAIYPDATHNSWERTYNNPDLYAWFLQHRR